MVEKRKTEAMAAKCQKTRKRISLFNEEEKNYKSNTKDEKNLDQDEND